MGRHLTGSEVRVGLYMNVIVCNSVVVGFLFEKTCVICVSMYRCTNVN